MSLPPELAARLRLPAIGAPMFIVSQPELHSVAPAWLGLFHR
jgi:hypothetical protein